ncbi:hypothetical protein DSLASN_40870 [Desulfoluna limicola]|uniref:Transmembrane protein n=1 Tax=Desulfoluna limicola TaxID=2810562 RepID=A0ABM7PLZ8_9BACT|nr:YfiR family protein [Desulfoluna limicola]BCS98455.1 hypothetical protein DSLASN_40870 [Desulfoluna limicola]
MNIKRLAFISVVLCSIALHCHVPGLVSAEPATESRIKAAYLLNFARFVTWPDTAFESSVSPIVLCILGDSPIDNALPTIQYKRVQDRPLVIRRIPTMKDLSPCHMLFVGESEAPRIREILSELNAHPVLTVSSLPDFARRGGMLSFIKVENKIRFEVNLSTTQHAGLSISSRLLKLARLVPNP